MLNRIFELALSSALFLLLIDYQGQLKLKWISFFSLYFLFMCHGFFNKKIMFSADKILRLLAPFYMMGLVIVWGLIPAAKNGVGYGADTALFSFVAYGVAFCILLILSDFESLYRCFIGSLIILASLVWVVFLCDFFGRLYLFWFLVEDGALYFGSRDYFGVEMPYIYPVSGFLLVYLLADTYIFGVRDRKYYPFVFVLLTCFLTGNRFLMLSGVFVSLLFFLRLSMRSIMAVIFFALVGSHIFIFSSGDMRSDYFENYATILDIDNFLFGTGINSGLYNDQVHDLLNPSGSSTFHPRVELSYMELLRSNGFLGLAMFVGIILYGAIKISPYTVSWSRLAFLIGFGLQVLSAVVNPNIFLLAGGLTFSMFYSLTLKGKR